MSFIPARVLFCVLVLNALLTGCGSSAVTTPNPTPPPTPSISQLSVSLAVVGSAALTVTVTGSDYLSDSVVQWNGSSLNTTYQSATQLQATIPAADLTTAGNFNVTVSTTTAGGTSVSNTMTFTVLSSPPKPSISSLSATSVAAGSNALTLTVTGSDFLVGAIAQWNGSTISTNFQSTTQLQISVPATDLATAGAFQITVVNSAAGLTSTSNAVNFEVTANNPVPSITSLSTSSATAGGAAFALTISGAQFAVGATVHWNGAALTTTVTSATQLTAQVPASDIANVGTDSVTVVNPTPGGGTSNALTFTVNAQNPAPTLSTLSPNNAGAGAAALLLTVSGTDFVTSSVINWNGVALPTTYVSTTQLTTTVPAADLTVAGAASVTVSNPAPGGGTSSASTFTINAINPTPTTTALSPANAAVGSAAFTLTVNGTNFVNGSVINWNGVALTPTTYVSGTQLTALVPASDLTAVANVPVTVSSPGTPASNAQTFHVQTANPAPTISLLSARFTAAGSPAFTMTVTGSGFVSSSVVQWNGAALPTTFYQATTLTATVPAANLTTKGTFNVSVNTPAPGGGTSGIITFSVTTNNPKPTLTSMTPSSALAGSGPVALTLYGSSTYVPTSYVLWNGTQFTTTQLSASSLAVQVPASFVANPGTAIVQVVSPPPGGGTSTNSLTFTVSGNFPTPVLNSLSTSSAPVGSAGFTLTANGSDFSSGSVIQWNGAALATTYVSSTELTAPIPTADLAAVGTFPITVDTPAPGGGVSAAINFNVVPATAAPYIRQYAQYNAKAANGQGANSNEWVVTLPNVQAGSTIYVVGVWPIFAAYYPNMTVTDSGAAGNANTYTALERIDDPTLFNDGMQGTESMSHWVASNVAADTYTINLSPTPITYEDYVGIVAFEVVGAGPSPIVAHSALIQYNQAPGALLGTAATATAPNQLVIGVTFDDLDGTSPTVPLVGSGFSDQGQLWDFNKGGMPSGRAESVITGSAGTLATSFTAQEPAGPGQPTPSQWPDYLSTEVILSP